MYLDVNNHYGFDLKNISVRLQIDNSGYYIYNDSIWHETDTKSQFML